MLIFKLDKLIKQKEIEEGAKISDTYLAEELGISRQTISKIKNHHITQYVTTTDILEKILKYFECDDIGELIEYHKNKNS